MSPAVAVRLLHADDSAALADLFVTNRAYLAPFEPVRDEAFFTEPGQAERVAQLLTQFEQGRAYPYVIEVGGTLAGQISVTNVSRGPFCSGNLGYWVAAAHTGRGVATHATTSLAAECFTVHDLHRLEAATLLDNVASQKVLARAGFTGIGMAPRYLNIAGAWRDHLLFQRLADDPIP